MERLKKMSFRFFFVYFLLTIAPWMYLEVIPGVSFVTGYYRDAMLWIVTFCNDYLLYVKPVLNTQGFGSGDTSYGWAEFYTIILLSILVAGIWTAFDKDDNRTKKLSYWLHNLVRYNLIMVSFSYGIIKLFALQMPFPSLSQMATPLGDYLPMRFSWLFIGYSEPYQMFSGVMEVSVGLLLLYRRTIPLGLIIGMGVFTNVFLLNLCYDIPVKLYSMQIVICCLFLLLIDSQKFLNFFVFNKATIPTTGYNYRFTKKWQRTGRIVLKTVFILFSVGYTLFESYTWYSEIQAEPKGVIPEGVYQIKSFKKNDALTAIDPTDSLAWKDIIFEKEEWGSIKTADTTFRTSYGRGYFAYKPNEKKKTLAFRFRQTDTVDLFVMQYKLQGRSLELKGKFKNDSVQYELVRSDKKFPMAQRQFHWISERNR